MYRPEHFDVASRDEAFAFLESHNFGQLISSVEGLPVATPMPFLLSSDRRFLRGHLARRNPQWRAIDGTQVLVSLMGPHAYVSPSWYDEPGVPTWNYQALQLYGNCRTFEDTHSLAELVEALTAKHEARLPQPWSADYAPGKLRAIVGLEINISEIQCKYKLSQNRNPKGRAQVASALRSQGNIEIAQAMESQDRSSGTS